MTHSIRKTIKYTNQSTLTHNLNKNAHLRSKILRNKLKRTQKALLIIRKKIGNSWSIYVPISTTVTNISRLWSQIWDMFRTRSNHRSQRCTHRQIAVSKRINYIWKWSISKTITANLTRTFSEGHAMLFSQKWWFTYPGGVFRCSYGRPIWCIRILWGCESPLRIGRWILTSPWLGEGLRWCPKRLRRSDVRPSVCAICFPPIVGRRTIFRSATENFRKYKLGLNTKTSERIK